jgi:hypothetical protein
MNPEKTRIRIPIALIDQLRIKYPERLRKLVKVEF